MGRTSIFTACALLGSLAGCAHYGSRADRQEAEGQAALFSSSGQPVGSAELVETGNRLFLQVTAMHLPPGPHGLHLHETGRCDGPDFKSAGGHLNPAHASHGHSAEKPGHLGDLPNLMVRPDGTASARLPVSENAQSDLAHIFDSDGTALIIHAGADDYRSDPAGNAGPRIACGVFARR